MRIYHSFVRDGFAFSMLVDQALRPGHAINRGG